MFRWWKNKRVKDRLPNLNSKKKWLTVINRLGARGDTLITANVIRCIKDEFPNIKINCITPYPELIQYDPEIDAINKPETFYSFDSSYVELIERDEKDENVVEHNLKRIGIGKYSYKSNFHLLESEKNWSKEQFPESSKPIIAISTKSKETIKNWPETNWQELINTISIDFKIILLGDEKEPCLQNVERFAGNHSMRESAALLSQCILFIGPDSLLMHIANGLDIKSIIIFGNARPSGCLGYDENINISLLSDEGPSWRRLPKNCDINENMNQITAETVTNVINRIFA